MTGPDRTVQLLGFAVPRSGRARFVEEWQADIVAGRMLGLSSSEIVTAAARVAVFLFWIRVRDQLRRRRARSEVLASGVLLGFVLVVTDVPLDVFAPVVAPFALLAIGARLFGTVRAWIQRGE